MISVGNSKIKEIYVGSTKIKEVYVGSVKVFPSEPDVVWYDDEFKTVALTALNSGKAMTESELAAVTNTQFAKVSFENNTTVKSIKDLEKFTSVTKIPNRCFAGCTALGTENLTTTGDIDDTILNIPANVTEIGNYAFLNCKGYKGITIDHVVTCSNYAQQSYTGCFSGMHNVQGVVDLSNLRNITEFHEFDGFGQSGTGVKVVLPTTQACFGTWFPGAKVTAIADSVANLEDGKIKVPNNYTHDFHYAFGANYGKGNNDYTLDGVRVVNSIIGGDNSSTSCKSITFGEDCKYITGPCLSDNENTYTITCKAITPPKLGLGGIGFYSGSDVTLPDGQATKQSEAVYPFMYTSRVNAIYVPAEAVEAYKNDTGWCVPYATAPTSIPEGTTVVEEECNHKNYLCGEGEISCYGTTKPTLGYPEYGEGYTIDDRVIGWSRFADKIQAIPE